MVESGGEWCRHRSVGFECQLAVRPATVRSVLKEGREEGRTVGRSLKQQGTKYLWTAEL